MRRAAKKTCVTKSVQWRLKVNDGLAELEENVTDRLDKQLKGVTCMVG
jgi:hypothetical protein